MTSPGRMSGFRSQYQEPSASSMRREPSSRRRARRLASLVATEARHRGRPRTRQHARRDGPRTGRCRWPRAPGRGQPTRRGPPRTRPPRAGRAPRPGTRRAAVSGRGIRDPVLAGRRHRNARVARPRTGTATGVRDRSSVQVKDRQAFAEQREIELLVLRRQEGVAYTPPPRGSGLRQIRQDSCRRPCREAPGAPCRSRQSMTCGSGLAVLPPRGRAVSMMVSGRVPRAR